MGEEERTHIRQIRREANDLAKAMLKDKKVGEDEEHKTLDQIQKITDKYVHVVDDLIRNKEKEILEV